MNLIVKIRTLLFDTPKKNRMVSLHVVARENDASISSERWQLLAVLHA
jgi:hypothetical protein